jgi:hypothetical protein
LLEDFRELENQEIYFASPQKLNDPMEGFKDIFWRGDEIIWANLLRHYLPPGEIATVELSMLKFT